MICTDSPRGWRSSTKTDCQDYIKQGWCTETGDYGPQWGDNGDFEDWGDKDQVSAVEACCACGGGSKVTISLSDLGQDRCAGGSPITDEYLCRIAAKSQGAEFSMSADWPTGTPPGCHMDAARTTVWLNTHSGGSGQDHFLVLCAVEATGASKKSAQLEDDKEDDDDDDEEDGEEGSKEAGKDDADEDEDIGKKEAGEAPKAGGKSERSGPVRAGYKEEKAKLEKAIVEAHKELAVNMKRRVQIGLDLHHLQDEGNSEAEIDSSMKVVANETQSPALGQFLGDMWKELRMFASPFYQERVEEEFAALEAEEPRLEAKYDKAKHDLIDLDHEKIVKKDDQAVSF